MRYAVRLLVTYDFAPRASWQERLDLANRINDGYIMARASLPEARPGTLAVDYYVMLGAGVSRANVVALTATTVANAWANRRWTFRRRGREHRWRQLASASRRPRIMDRSFMPQTPHGAVRRGARQSRPSCS